MLSQKHGLTNQHNSFSGRRKNHSVRQILGILCVFAAFFLAYVLLEVVVLQFSYGNYTSEFGKGNRGNNEAFVSC